MSIRITGGDTTDTFEVSGRGELQIAVLIETMRREGFEFAVSQPQIIERTIDHKRCEPVEDVVAEVPQESTGAVMEKLGSRRGRLVQMESRGARTLLNFIVPSRGLFGYRTEFLTDTRGEGTLYRTVRGYEPLAGDLEGRGVGAIVATETGRSTSHAIFAIQERATMFIGNGESIYEGQVVGENRRPKDMNVNVCRAKKLTNVRNTGHDEAEILTPPRRFTIESALEWIEADELLEVTPKSLRLRKRLLPANLRKRP